MTRSRRKSPRTSPSRLTRPKRTRGPFEIESDLRVSIEFPSERIAKVIETALAPETRPASGFRSKVKVSSRGKVLELNIQTSDIVAMRAAANSFLRLVAAAAKTVDVVAPFYSGQPAGDVSKSEGPV